MAAIFSRSQEIFSEVLAKDTLWFACLICIFGVQRIIYVQPLQ